MNIYLSHGLGKNKFFGTIVLKFESRFSYPYANARMKSSAKSIPKNFPPAGKCFFDHLFRRRVTDGWDGWTLLV